MIKVKRIISPIGRFYGKFFQILENILAPVLILSIRLWMANTFFKSGRTKFANIDSAIYLFEYDYGLPLISPVFAAYTSTFFELVCPVLLAIGFLTRLATIPLIFMVLIIQFLVVQNIEHFYWLFLLMIILVNGGGKLSLDRFLKIK